MGESGWLSGYQTRLPPLRYGLSPGFGDIKVVCGLSFTRFQFDKGNLFS